MNGRTSKLMAHVANALIQGGDKPKPPASVSGRGLFNHARNLKRKLGREWGSKPANQRGAQRLGLIRTLVAIQEAAHG